MINYINRNTVLKYLLVLPMIVISCSVNFSTISLQYHNIDLWGSANERIELVDSQNNFGFTRIIFEEDDFYKVWHGLNYANKCKDGDFTKYMEFEFFVSKESEKPAAVLKVNLKGQVEYRKEPDGIYECPGLAKVLKEVIRKNETSDEEKALSIVKQRPEILKEIDYFKKFKKEGIQLVFKVGEYTGKGSDVIPAKSWTVHMCESHPERLSLSMTMYVNCLTENVYVDAGLEPAVLLEKYEEWLGQRNSENP